MAFLELSGISKGFASAGKRLPVLRDINLRINKGEFVAIVGYSGAGKTTLISMIAGLLQPDAGSITLNELEITRPGPDRGVVFQNYSLLPWLSVQENIHLAVDQVFPNWSSVKKIQHVARYIEMVNLSAAAQKKPNQLSGGMRQRVSVARALAIEPQILLLDEPLSALDALTRATLQDEILRIWEHDKKTVVLITNDVDEGILMADRIVPLSAGPNATLGPSTCVDLPRPRDRKALNHETRYREIRAEIIGYLLGAGGKARTTLTRELLLPNLEPEDLSRPRRPFFARRPIRRSEIHKESVEVNA